MTFVYTEKSNKLRIKNDFATLLNISNDGDLIFSFSYSISQTDVIKFGNTKVRITVKNGTTKPISIFENKSGINATNDEVVKNITALYTNYSTNIKNNQALTINETISDITAWINNQFISPIRNGTSYKDIQLSYKTKITLKPISEINVNNESFPVLYGTSQKLTSVPVESTVKNAISKSMIKYGVDPSEVIELAKERLSTHKNVKGTLFPTSLRRNGFDLDNIEFSPIRKMFRQIAENDAGAVSISSDTLSANDLVQVIETVSSDIIEIPAEIKLLKDKIIEDGRVALNTTVKFELLNDKNVPVDVVTKDLDLAKHIRTYMLPKLSPEVKFSYYKMLNRATLHIKQNDESAIGVKIYIRSIFHSSNEIDDYVFYGQFAIKKSDGIISIPINISRTDTTLFRVIPFGENRIDGFEYTNLVINPENKRVKYKFVSLIANSTQNGISLAIRELPPDVISFKIIRKNKTIHDNEYSIIGGDNVLVDQTSNDRTYVVIDTSVKSHNVYEYCADLLYKDGTTSKVGNILIEYLPLIENLVDTRIQNLNTTQDDGKLDVTFDLESSLGDGDLDILKKLLDQQEITKYFESDILKERDKLKRLIAHGITRVNLTTGQRENFGVITDKTFQDSKFRKINSVSDLKVGNRYRYDIVTLLRYPETLFQDAQKSVTDQTTKKSYTFKPGKFLNPLTLRIGSIVDKNAQNLMFAKDDMSLGEVGNLVSLDVSFAEDVISIYDVQAERFDKRQTVLTWKLNGSSKLVDHFIIFLNENGLKHPIGKVHSTDEKRVFEYIHLVDQEDIGGYSYIVKPVYRSYLVGTAVSSNKVVI